jgi:hypothetical protein
MLVTKLTTNLKIKTHLRNDNPKESKNKNKNHAIYFLTNSIIQY